MNRLIVSTLLAMTFVAGVTACTTREVATGAAAGAAAGGAAYEYSNKQAMDDLKEDYEEGRITREEYEQRKQDIEDRSLVY